LVLTPQGLSTDFTITTLYGEKSPANYMINRQNFQYADQTTCQLDSCQNFFERVFYGTFPENTFM
jgi:hypothetical protein